MSEPSAPAPRPIAWLRNKFLAGLAIFIPLLVTFWILRIIYEFLHDLSRPLLLAIAGLYNQGVDDKFRLDTSGLGFANFTSFVGFLIPVVVLVGLGVVATNVIGARLVAMMERLLLHIPIISFIYKSLKQVIDAFKGLGGAKGFKRVVYVEYPSPGMRLIGFATGQFFDKLSSKAVTCVFIPTAPSPMTGFVIVADSEKVTDSPLTMEEAMKLIFSGGLVGPESMAPVTSAPIPPPPRKKPAPVLVPQPEEFVGLPKADDPDEFIPGEDPKLKLTTVAAGKPSGRSWTRLWKR